MRAFLLTLLLLFVGPAAGGKGPGAPPGADRPAPDERPGDPPAPTAARDDPDARSRPIGFVARPYPSVQVNVDAEGLNIVGDAANEPSIAVDAVEPTRLAIGWRQFDSIASSFREAGWAYSGDAGRTWTFPGVLEEGVFRSDPVLDSDPDGAIHYLSLTSDEFGDLTCQVFTSADGGMTWTDPVPAFGGDKPWLAVDRSDGPGRGNVYSFFRIGVSTEIGFIRSFDGAASFEGIFPVPDRPGRGTLAAGPDSVVHLAGFSFLSSNIVYTRTANAYVESEAPRFDPIVTLDLGGTFRDRDGPNPGGLLGQINVAADLGSGPTRGNVYVLASMNPPGGDPLDVFCVRSLDGGRTWSAPVRVNDDPPSGNVWQWFGTLAVAPTGRLDAVWNDTRATASANRSELYYAWSNDAGATWSPNIPITPVFDSWLGWPQQNKIGDYYDMVSDAAATNVAYAATFNGEQDVYFVRIGDCNDNGVHDGTDIADRTSRDANGNGIPDECECAGDVDGNGVVDTADIIAVLAAWGPCPGCPEDIDGDGTVAFEDLLAVLATWGPCV